MSVVKEFRDFISRGNVLDLAVGVIIGAAFTAIVNSLVDDLINPMLGLLTGGRTNFTNYYIPLSGQGFDLSLEQARAAGGVLAYGAFLTAVINFLIIAVVIFLLVRFINSTIRRALPVIQVTTPDEIMLLSEIRDLLKKEA